MFFIRDGEMGDKDRFCIGGVDSMYRMKSYKGEFDDSTRHGQGILTYTNDDRLEGHFVQGQPHGTVLYFFASTGKMSIAEYKNGYRVQWIERKKTASRKSSKKKSIAV
jgi:hypothetical protein